MNGILELSVHGSLVFLLVWILDRLLASRMRAKGRRWWWITVPIAFLVSIPLSLLPGAVSASTAHGAFVWGPVVHAEIAAQSVAGKIGLNKGGIWPWLWLAGAVTYILTAILQTKAATVRWSGKRLTTDSGLLDLLEDCKLEAWITAPIGLVVSGSVSAPAIMGWLRPRILLPESLTSSMSRDQLRVILLHELAHFHSFDIPLNWLYTLARAVHWFNPLAYFSFRAWADFREEAADETAMAWMKESSSVFYGEALICAVRAANGDQLPFGTLAIGESIHNLKRRIIMIKHYQNKSSHFILAYAALILVVVGFVVRPIRAENAGPKITGGTLNQMMQIIQANAEKTAPDKPGFRILQAFCGADGSWRDVTLVLRNSVKENALHVSWQQPYRELGGDPAAGKIKTLLISFQMNGKIKTAVFQEENPPVGLRASLP